MSGQLVSDCVDISVYCVVVVLVLHDLVLKQCLLLLLLPQVLLQFLCLTTHPVKTAGKVSNIGCYLLIVPLYPNASLFGSEFFIE
jgi:hypothetical protein